MIVGSDKYRFYINYDGTNYVTVKLAKPVTITGKLGDIPYAYSRKSSVWKFVRYENAALYDTLLSLIEAPSDLSNEILVKLELRDDWTSVTSTEYTGYVPISGISYNEDTGVMELQPTERSDYQWYDQHKNDKIDVYNEVIGTYERLAYLVTTETEEYWVPADGQTDIDGYTYATPNGFHREGDAPSKWNAATNYVSGYEDLSWCYYPTNQYMYHCLADNTNVQPGAPGSSSYWELIESEAGGYIHLRDHIYREVADLPYYSGATYTQGTGMYEDNFPATKYQAGGYVQPLVTEVNNAPKHRWINYDSPPVPASSYMILCGTTTPSSVTVSTGPNHSLLEIIKHLFQINYRTKTFAEGSGLSITSQFFTDALNPITGTTNKFINTRLVHNRVLKGIQDIETKAEMTLEQLLRDLCETLQLGWAIVGTTLYIEHIHFFENGFTYSGSPSVYSDLTTYNAKYQVVNDLDGSQSDNQFKFSLTDCPEKELFKFPDGYDYDGQIKYDTKFVQKGETLEHNVSTFMTDFAYVIAYRVDSLDDSWCLICSDTPTLGQSVIYRRDANFRWKQCPVTVLAVTYNEYYLREETNYPNGDLMWNNILRDFWALYPIFKRGAINGKYPSETFDAVSKRYKRIKRQREILFPRIESGAFDPKKLITTNIGDGRVESFEINTDTDYIKVELSYEES